MKVMTVFGTRPEGIKMAPLVKAIQADQELEGLFVNTAQHREMLDQVLNLFSITADYDLNIMRPGQTPQSITAEIITGLSNILVKEKPDIVLVHGDTTTTFAASYAAFLQQIPVGHVEAGLRTHDIYSPFPEELNRQLVGRIAAYHFAPTARNKQNLLDEHIKESSIHVVGNTVIDALHFITSKKFSFTGELEKCLAEGRKIILLTTHRRENLEQLKGVYEAINELVRSHDDIQVIFPVHRNPAVRELVSSYLNPDPRVLLVEPLDYESFSHLMKRSYLIITDSGGIQEEAPALGVPVLVARDNTERPEGVSAGTLKLVGTSADIIFREAHTLLLDNEAYLQMSKSVNPYGDGRASLQIISALKGALVVV